MRDGELRRRPCDGVVDPVGVRGGFERGRTTSIGGRGGSRMGFSNLSVYNFNERVSLDGFSRV